MKVEREGITETVTVKFPPSLLARLDSEAKRIDRDRSWLLRLFVESGLERVEAKR